MLKIVCVCGARPNFMKIAPICDALAGRQDVHTHLVHTGQHYDDRMSSLFFDELAIPKPDVNLDVGSGSHAVQTADIMKRFDRVCEEFEPNWVVVVGDVNSTLAASIVAAKRHIKVAHVEAGLRSFDRTMPEEINRVLTDSISDLLFVSEPSGVDNLRREGIDERKIHLVGNVMIDTLLRNRSKADESTVLTDHHLKAGQYAAVTLHRPSNVDDPDIFKSILDALLTMAKDMPVVFPMHPRTRKNLAQLELAASIEAIPNLKILDPLGYLDFLKLMSQAAVVLTDSGGIQEETTILKVPCLTLRSNTERPITIEQGTNRLTESSTDAILSAYRNVCEHPPQPKSLPKLWDGCAAKRIVNIMLGQHSVTLTRASHAIDAC